MSFFSSNKSGAADGRTLSSSDMASQIAAINRSQAVIEFTPDGNIIHANPNFLNALGYTADEVKGKHHSMLSNLAIARARITAPSGRSSAAVNSMPISTSASPKAAGKSGFRRATTRWSTAPARSSA